MQRGRRETPPGNQGVPTGNRWTQSECTRSMHKEGTDEEMQEEI